MAASADRPLGALLDDIAAQTPAPGGGSTAGWATALAAALTEMAARFAADDAAIARARELRTAALALAERELSSYAPVLEAMRRPRDDPGRAAGIDAALSAAAEAPLELARVADEVARLAGRLAHEGRPALAGDAATGEQLARAACRAAAHLVEIDLEGRPEDPRRAEAARLAAGA